MQLIFYFFLEFFEANSKTLRLLEILMRILKFDMSLVPILSVLYLSLPLSRMANFYFFYFGSYHWSGYAYAVFIGWFAFFGILLGLLGIFLIWSSTLSIVLNLKLLR